MTTTLKLWDGRRVAIEQTTTAIIATFEGCEPKAIDSRTYMKYVLQGTPCDSIK